MIARSTSSRTRDESSPDLLDRHRCRGHASDPLKRVDDGGQLLERRARRPAVARLGAVRPEPLPRLRADELRRLVGAPCRDRRRGARAAGSTRSRGTAAAGGGAGRTSSRATGGPRARAAPARPAAAGARRADRRARPTSDGSWTSGLAPCVARTAAARPSAPRKRTKTSSATCRRPGRMNDTAARTTTPTTTRAVQPVSEPEALQNRSPRARS